jgi:cytochrome c oxidase subunit III
MEIIVPLTELEKQQKNATAKRSLLWFGIVSIVMLFAGLTSAYMVRQGEGKWLQFAMPNLFMVSTLIILASSATMQWAVSSIRKNSISSFRTALLLTTLLGLGFVLFQYLAWQDLVAQGIYLVGTIKDVTAPATYIAAGTETLADAANSGNVAASFLYIITGLHVVHLFGGILALLFVNIKAIRGKYSAANYNGVRMCATYWHFLDGLWIYLFVFLWYIR